MSLIEQINNKNSLVSTNQVKHNTLDKQAFLNLLVTQLKYQDPLNPMENTEFVAQLSQFSSLEQLWNVNENLQTGALFSQSIHNSLIASLVGKEIKASGSSIVLSNEGQTRINYHLAKDAAVSISIYDVKGNLVRTLNLGNQSAGNQTITWDGKDNNGERLATGQFTVQIKSVDASGNAVANRVYITGVITGVRYEEGAPLLLMGDIEIKPNDVVEIMMRDSN